MTVQVMQRALEILEGEFRQEGRDAFATMAQTLYVNPAFLQRMVEKMTGVRPAPQMPKRGDPVEPPFGCSNG